MNVQGGKSIYGASVGILMLETQFPRLPGDMGNALTWPFPVHYKIVPNASPDQVVLNEAEGLYDNFLNAARELVEMGADGITTSCGFLIMFQNELSHALNVPVATSSLLQVPMVEKLLPPGKRAGILTISSATLSRTHLTKAGCAPDTPVGGTSPDGEFTRAILENKSELDVELARAENVAAATRLQKLHPELGAIVLECSNMALFAADIRAATGLPVFSINNLVYWFQAGLNPPSY